jgi:hypothetical protein
MLPCCKVMLAAVVVAASAVTAAANRAPSTVAQWAAFEATLNATGSARHLNNPFTDLELTVTCTLQSPDQQ